MSKFLDQAGLQIVWARIKAKYADRTELAQFLKNLDSKIQSDAGTARIFNEVDGGGAKFEGANGYNSFAGVNSDTKDGIGAQLYDINAATNKGSKIDVTADGVYYTKGDTSALPASQRDVRDNEIATIKDIADLGRALHYIGMTTLASGETFEQALARIVVAYQATHLGYELTAGAVAIVNTAENGVEFIYNGTNWDEFGDEGLYETKADAEAKYNEIFAAIDEAVTELEAEIAAEEARATAAEEAEEARAIAAEATKVDKHIAGTNGDAYIFNESDGGGARFVNNDGSEAFVGVNDGGKDGLMAQIYADVQKDGEWSGSRINVYNNKIYYQSQANTDAGVAKNNPGLEIATVKDVADATVAMTQEEIEEICK